MENSEHESLTQERESKPEVDQKSVKNESNTLIPILFAGAFIFFFFSFFTVSCGEQKIATVTGINLVTGTNIEGLDDEFGGDKKNNVPSNIWAIIAFGAALVGFGGYVANRDNITIGVIAGFTGAISLLILQFVIRAKISNEFEDSPLQINFEIGYWLSFITMGIAGVLSLLRVKDTSE